MDVILDRGSTPLTSRTKKGTLQEFLSFYSDLWNGLVEFTISELRSIRTPLQKRCLDHVFEHIHFRSDIFLFLIHFLFLIPLLYPF